MKRFLFLLGSVLVLLVGVALVRTLRFRSVQPAVERAPEVAIPEGAAERLAGAVRIPTISHEDPSAFDAGAFQALHAYLGGAVSPSAFPATAGGRGDAQPPVHLARK